MSIAGNNSAKQAHFPESSNSALTSTKKQRTGRQVSYPWIGVSSDPPREPYKGMCRVLRKASRWKVQKFQYIKCSLSSRPRATRRRFGWRRRGCEEAWRGWRRNNDNPSRCTSISLRRMPHIFADTNDATSRTNTCLAALRSSVTLGSPCRPRTLFFTRRRDARNNTLPLTGRQYFSLHNVGTRLRGRVDWRGAKERREISFSALRAGVPMVFWRIFPKYLCGRGFNPWTSRSGLEYLVLSRCFYIVECEMIRCNYLYPRRNAAAQNKRRPAKFPKASK